MKNHTKEYLETLPGVDVKRAMQSYTDFQEDFKVNKMPAQARQLLLESFLMGYGAAAVDLRNIAVVNKFEGVQ